MGKMKYVVIESLGILKPVIFDTLLEHKMFQNYKVKSAGFVSFWIDEDGEMQVNVWGSSTTLDMISVPDDADVIKKSLDRNY